MSDPPRKSTRQLIGLAIMIVAGLGLVVFCLYIIISTLESTTLWRVH